MDTKNSFDRKKFLPLIFWMAVIFILSSVPGKEYPSYDIPHLDKVVHFGLYGVLGYAAWFAFAAYGQTKGKSASWMAGVAASVALIYAVSDELHQLYVPFRSCDAADLIADAMGIGAVVGWKYFTFKDAR